MAQDSQRRSRKISKRCRSCRARQREKHARSLNDTREPMPALESGGQIPKSFCAPQKRAPDCIRRTGGFGGCALQSILRLRDAVLAGRLDPRAGACRKLNKAPLAHASLTAIATRHARVVQPSSSCRTARQSRGSDDTRVRARLLFGAVSTDQDDGQIGSALAQLLHDLAAADSCAGGAGQ